jgi:hypothetical protein
MELKQIFHRLVDMGEQADKFAVQKPNHRIPFKGGTQGSLFMAARDLATGIENTIRSASPATLEQIARS